MSIFRPITEVGRMKNVMFSLQIPSKHAYSTFFHFRARKNIFLLRNASFARKRVGVTKSTKGNVNDECKNWTILSFHLAVFFCLSVPILSVFCPSQSCSLWAGRLIRLLFLLLEGKTSLATIKRHKNLYKDYFCKLTHTTTYRVSRKKCKSLCPGQ